MPYRLEREKTNSTPYVLADEEKSYLLFRGESFHENVIEFYGEIDEWLGRYMQSDFKTFTFDCELHYFNSSTAKLLLNLLLNMDNIVEGTNKEVIVNWITTEDNDVIIECGEDFRDEVNNLTFNLVLC